MKKWNLIIDVEKCEDCNNCLLACKDEHVDNEFPEYTASQPKHGHRWIDILRKERGQYPFIDVAYLPVPCYHCDDAPCVKAAKDGAVYQRKDGIVIIDPIKARGQEKIVKSCPFDAIWWNEEKGVPQKCTFCAHLLDEGWKEPRCVNACPTGALRAVKIEDSRMKKLVTREGLQLYEQKGNVKPRVYYKNLHRYTRCFIGGSVAATRDSITDCVEAADVILQNSSGQEIAKMSTDIFGDFKFDNLEAGSSRFTIKIRHEEFGEKDIEVELTESRYVGTIEL